MKRQNRRLLGFALSCAALCSGSVFFSTQQAQADGKEAKKYLETYVTVVAKVYPPAAPVFGAMIKMLDFTGYFGKSADPVGEALKTINNRLDDHERQINKLSKDLDELRQGEMGERNWTRFNDLQESRNNLQSIAESLADRPTEKSMKTYLTGQARAEAARFLDLEMWTWSDKSISDKDQTWTDRNGRRRTYKPGEMLNPDFKAMPTLEYYTTALMVWMATLEYATDGNAANISPQDRAKVDEHIAWLSKRPSGNDEDGEPQSLPEHIRARVRGEHNVSSMYPDQGFCYYYERIYDDMRRASSSGEPKRYAEDRRNEMCNVPVLVRNRTPQLERDREREYGLDVMANLAALLTNLRDKGTVRGAAIPFPPSTPSQPNPSLPRPSPSSPKVEEGGRHKAMFEELGFRTDGGKVEENILYGVRGDNGDLIWHKHWIDFRPGQDRHKFAPTKKVGDGWKAGYKGAYAAGNTWIYTLSDAGELRLHRHLGAFDGSYKWREPSLTVAEGWGDYKQIIPVDHGVVYQLTRGGVLRWTNYWDYENPRVSGAGAWFVPRNAPGHWPYLTVFSGGNGVLYGVHIDGRLMWHKHVDYKKGGETWLGPKQVGEGWHSFTKIFSPGQGHIYAVLENGDLMYYRHTAWETGEYTWDENIKGKIASGWNGYASAFARSITGDPDEPDHPN